MWHSFEFIHQYKSDVVDVHIASQHQHQHQNQCRVSNACITYICDVVLVFLSQLIYAFYARTKDAAVRMTFNYIPLFFVHCDYIFINDLCQQATCRIVKLNINKTEIYTLQSMKIASEIFN